MATRDEDALSALNTRVAAIVGIWAIYPHNTKGAGLPGPTVGYILETPLGGPTTPGSIGAATALREFSRQWQLLLNAPVDSGKSYEAQYGAIEAALHASPIQIAVGQPDGPITIMIDDCAMKGPRPATKQCAHVTVPVVIAYRFIASS